MIEPVFGVFPLVWYEARLGDSRETLSKSEGSLLKGAACFVRAILKFANERVYTDTQEDKKVADGAHKTGVIKLEQTLQRVVSVQMEYSHSTCCIDIHFQQYLSAIYYMAIEICP